MAMHSNWNPWHGCIKCSEGCQNCYVYYLDSMYGKKGSDIYKTKGSFNYPISKDKSGNYKIKSGEMISVCMTSDFFLEEADGFRAEAWQMIKKRSDVKFLLLTKRPQRIKSCLPPDWNDGYENVFLNVTAENQTRADERIPILIGLPFKHKGLHVAPMLGPINLEKYLDSGQIEQVACGGENYSGRRECDYSWAKEIQEECVRRDITFCYMETGTTFIKDGKKYIIKSKQEQNLQAFKSGLTYVGKPIKFKLYDSDGGLLPEEMLYVPRFAVKCQTCSFKVLCNGCFNCGACPGWESS